MSVLTLLQGVGVALMVVLGLWIVVRVATAAYYRSKADYEKENVHGTQKHSR